MLHAFKFIFAGGAKRAVVIRTDSPALDRNIILEAFERLKKTSCVLGPAFAGIILWGWTLSAQVYSKR